MHNLLSFLVRYSSWILFTIYALISCSLLFKSNPYQHALYLTSANSISSGVYNTSNGITSYFNLRDINYDLQRNNAELERQVLNLKAEIRRYHELEYEDSVKVDPSLERYSFYIAHVINNSVSRPHNYITIDKGSEDGIRPEMGVIDQNGVVGIVNVVGPHSARIISLLNNRLRISCKIKESQHIGSLVWDGRSPQAAVLEELPRHATFHKGDTIVTSGYSTTFPEGVPVGTVAGVMRNYDDNFYALSVKLFTDFSTLSTVRIIADNMKDELEALEAQDEAPATQTATSSTSSTSTNL